MAHLFKWAGWGRVGPGDCSPVPLTEPDLWAHIRLFKLSISKQQPFLHDPRWVKPVPAVLQINETLGEPGVGIQLVDAEARTALPVTPNYIGRFPGHPAGYATT